MWIFWLIAAGIFFIIEIATVGFLIFWLAIGALFAMVTSFFTANIIIQTAVFVVISSILIPLTKPFVDKFTRKDSVPTNSYSLINKKGIVTKDINPTLGTGLVKVNGETWSAKTDDETSILKDTEVEIIAIDGVKLIVKPI
ncbi:MAG: NfeD family protein [Clostridia bacterium]|nr:NfeD family protein [Clostridia bacterium]